MKNGMFEQPKSEEEKYDFNISVERMENLMESLNICKSPGPVVFTKELLQYGGS